MTNHVTVATEIQAEVANKINRYSADVAEYLADIEKYTSKAQGNQNSGIAINFDIQSLTNAAVKLAEAHAKLDSFVQMANLVGLDEDALHAAYAPVRTWFHTEA